ncbi:MAG: gamma-glutamyl-gamma-aminobutyrate hydrolase family protein [Firmicutes bacterium]|nr:gamma-glutamyl-gamma-aminobutyrate hydrolase family protein [Bacillota bacterium]
MKPIIGISCNQRKWAGEYYLRTDYVRAIVENEGAPLLIPINQDSKVLMDSLERCEGLLLTGGGDLGPDFHQNRLPLFLENVDKERDWFEFGLIKVALKTGKPVLAVCRGLQVLNMALHGTLYRDINTELLNSGAHQRDSIGYEASHVVYFKENTRLFNIFGEEAFVNSAHHQGIKDLGKGLIIGAVSADGLIEAVEGEEGFIIGVQWHPERLLHIPPMNQLYVSFIEACRNKVKTGLNNLVVGC